MNRLLTIGFLRLGTGVVCGMLIGDALRKKDFIGLAALGAGLFLGYKYL